jgi:type III restriction enzyme
MRSEVNSIAGRLSLRPPQRRSLEILDRIVEIAQPCKGGDSAAALEVIRTEFASVTDFEREFPSLCFALATGVGKTRLMGAFISYLYLAHGNQNFFVLAPNLTIYNKLIADFTPNTPKYVFRGIAEFATEPPAIITGDNYDQRDPASAGLFGGVRVNIFNISKINSEVRGGKAPRIKRLSEYIGQSYFDYLASLPDLVLLMDESHRYRASAGVRAINDLKPVLGLELTATPFVESSRGAVPFRNVIFDYPLARAMADGFVKEPAVVTRKDFNPAGMSPEEIERLKLEDGIRLHESVKVELETYARETDKAIVKPFLLVIARDTTHAAELVTLIQSDAFFDGRYKEKVIQVDSSQTGAAEDAMVERLLKVEHPEEPTEIVVHVNMLKEGWDVTNLYTIVPLRAANARILIEQSIGRGLRLPYGKRTGVTAVDRLNIVAHDRFQEIIDEANRSDSPIRLQAVVLDAADIAERTVTVVSQPRLDNLLGVTPDHATAGTLVACGDTARAFPDPADQKVAQLTREVIRTLESQPKRLPALGHLAKPEIQKEIVAAVTELYQVPQMELEGISRQPDIAAVVARTTELVAQQTIDIPRILVVPKGEVKSGFKPFQLKLEGLRYAPVSEDLWVQLLRTGEGAVVALGRGGAAEARPEDYVVSGLVDFNDVSYDEHADLLYDLAGQVVRHLHSYLSEEEATRVLRCYQRDIARFVHAQMQEHYWEDVAGYEVKVTRGYTELRRSAYTSSVREPAVEYRVAPPDKSNMSRYLFSGFSRCLYEVQKFQSDPERVLAIILERDSERWFKPAKGQFQMFYRWNGEHPEYQPDFVAETADGIYMLEPKRKADLDDPEVQLKKEVAVQWCANASDYSRSTGGKLWRYALIPHDSIQENMTLAGLVRQFGVS